MRPGHLAEELQTGEGSHCRFLSRSVQGCCRAWARQALSGWCVLEGLKGRDRCGWWARLGGSRWSARRFLLQGVFEDGFSKEGKGKVPSRAVGGAWPHAAHVSLCHLQARGWLRDPRPVVGEAPPPPLALSTQLLPSSQRTLPVPCLSVGTASLGGEQGGTGSAQTLFLPSR